MSVSKKEYEEVKQIKPKGLNFRLLVPQLTEEFKLKIVLKEINLTDVFQITEPSEKYLISLIKYDIKSKLPIEKKEKYKLVDKIKQLFNK